MKRINATALRALTQPFAAPASAFPTLISRKENIMKTRFSSFIRRCAVQVLALAALAASSAVAQSTPGQINGALSFDGVDDCVEISPSNYLIYQPNINGDALTIEAWFRVDDMAPGRKHAVFSTGAPLDIALRILVEDDGKLHAGFKSRSWGEVYSSISTSPGSVVEGQWHHVACVVRVNSNRTTLMALYLDGAEAAHQQFQRVPSGINMTRLAIGKELRGGYYFGGAIDDVRFWDRQRSAGEIADNMHSALTGSEAGLIGYWPLDEKDTQPPTITLAGGNELTVGVSTSYVDSSVTATDLASVTQITDVSNTGDDGVFQSGGTPVPVDVSVSGTVGTKLGDYTLTYTATDPEGNTATATRLVHVVDTTPPVIELNGPEHFYVTEGVAYEDPVTAVDNVDGVVPVTRNAHPNPQPGDVKTVTYSATDAAGNMAVASRQMHYLSYGDGYGWEQMPGSAVDIAFGGNGDVYMIGGDSGNGIYKWDSQADDWDQVNGYGDRIGVAPDGTPWIVNDLGWVLRWDPASAAFVQVPDAGAGGALDIGMGNGVWVVAEHTPGGEHEAFRWNAASYSWQATGGYTGQAIDVAPDGSAWMRLDDGRILAFHASGSDWTGMPGDDVVDVALGYDGSAWCVADDGEVRRWNGSSYSWERVHGEGKVISVAPDGFAWVVRDDGSIWRGVPGGRYQ